MLTFCFILLVSCGSSQTKPGNINDKNNSSDIASSSNKTNNFETLARLPEPLEPSNKRLDEISDNDYFFFDKDLVYYTNNKSELVCYDYKKTNRYGIQVPPSYKTQ